MADEREGVTERTTIIEKRGGGVGIVIAILGLAVVVVLAWFLFAQNRNDTVKTDAVAGAADSVSKAADKVGDAAEGK